MLKSLLVAFVLSYLATWSSGLYISRQTRLNRAVAKRLHLGLSLIT